MISIKNNVNINKLKYQTMKKILFLFSLLFCVQAYGQTTVDGIRYKFSKTEAQVTSMYPEYSGDIEIPSTITYNGTIYNVTSIGKEAFSECEDLTSVKIPNSVKSIGDYAFFECTNLSSVNIPDSVKVIGNGIFCYCNHLTSITIPPNLNMSSPHMRFRNRRPALRYCRRLP